MSDRPVSVALELVDPHPRNPRLHQRQDVVDAIAASIEARGFDPAYAVILRPLGDRRQIVSGHHRVAAARQAGLAEVPAWVREMDDDDAYMALVTSNAQSELSALERGLHVLGSGKSLREYIRDTGGKLTTVTYQRQAAEVFTCVNSPASCQDLDRHLAEIHAAPRWLWPALVEKLEAESLTVARLREVVAETKGAPEPHQTFNTSRIAERIVARTMKPSEIGAMNAAYEVAPERFRAAGGADLADMAEWQSRIQEKPPGSLMDLDEVTRPIIRKIEDRQAAVLRAQMQAREQTSKLRSNISLEEWKSLEEDERAALLDIAAIGSDAQFNRQSNNDIEWAQWSWNPVTGCLHDCPYCYARDIAHSARMAKAYPNGFEPTFRPASLSAPRSTKPPKEVATDARFRNVFTCSMADLFGRWVPAEWIDAVLGAVRENPQWNFLMLTKFPKRMSEFDIPNNTWMGTTVDLQARVRNAEAAFANVNAAVRWLSVEPLLEPLRFSRLDLFQWIVIGGASSSSKTPEWRPPFPWIVDLVTQAREAKCRVYFKTNLLGNRILELPADAPIVGDPTEAPAVFHYLSTQKTRATAEAA